MGRFPNTMAGTGSEQDTTITLKSRSKKLAYPHWRIYDGTTREETEHQGPMWVVPIEWREIRTLMNMDYVPGAEMFRVCSSWDGQQAHGLGRRPEPGEAWQSDVKTRNCAECPSQEWGTATKNNEPIDVGRLCDPICYSLVLWARGHEDLDIDELVFGWWEQGKASGRALASTWQTKWRKAGQENGKVRAYKVDAQPMERGMGVVPGQVDVRTLEGEFASDVLSTIESRMETLIEQSLERGRQSALRIGSKGKGAAPEVPDEGDKPKGGSDEIPF